VLVTRAMVADRAAAERLRGELIRGAVAEQLQSGPDQGVSAERIWLQDVPKKPEMTVVALGLDPGGVSPVLTTATGFAVLRADKREPARLRPFDEVRSGVQAKLQDAARRADAARVRQRLRKGVDVEIIEAALSFYLPPAPAASCAG